VVYRPHALEAELSQELCTSSSPAPLAARKFVLNQCGVPTLMEFEPCGLDRRTCVDMRTLIDRMSDKIGIDTRSMANYEDISDWQGARRAPTDTPAKVAS
jgi:hypothetical protein